MRISDIETVEATFGEDNRLERIELRPSRFSAVFFLLLLVPATLALMIPVLMLAATAVAEPASRAMIAGQPMAVAQTVLGLIVWALLWGVPASRFFNRLGRQRSVEIDGTQVRVADRSMAGTSTWTAELTDFIGLAHHVRASLSGSRHELILVHEDAEKSLLVHAGALVTDRQTADFAAQLNQCVVHGSALYASSRRSSPEAAGMGAMAPTAA